MAQYKTKNALCSSLMFPEYTLSCIKDNLDELRDDLYEADDLGNDKESIKKSIEELEEMKKLIQEHIEIKKDKNARLTKLEILYIRSKNMTQ